MAEPFKDRVQAGLVLVQKLKQYANTADLLVIGLPRGGIEVAYQVAMALGGELDVFIVRKLGAPYQPELAMGAIAEGGMLLLNDAVVNYFSISKEAIEISAKKELLELERRVQLYRNGREPPKIQGRTVIVVDDGVATGATMKVALRAIRRKEPSRLIVAVPVGAQSTCDELRSEADEVICVLSPEPFMAVGSWFENFEQTTDDQVRVLLENAFKRKTIGHNGRRNHDVK